MKKLSIVGKDYHTEEHVVGYYSTGDRMLYWGELGAFWGGFWGLLLGSAFFWVPGIGPLVVLTGPLAAISGLLAHSKKPPSSAGSALRRRSALQHRHPKRQRDEIRDRSEERQTAAGRPPDARRG